MAQKPIPEQHDIYVADPRGINVHDDHKEEIVRRYGITEVAKKSSSVLAIGRTTEDPHDDEKLEPVFSPEDSSRGLTKEGWWLIRHKCAIEKAHFKGDALDYRGTLIPPESDQLQQLWYKNSVLGPF
jgi:hypothetical protein